MATVEIVAGRETDARIAEAFGLEVARLKAAEARIRELEARR